MTASPWTAVALAKLESVVGRERAEEVLAATLRDLVLDDLRSVDDLYAFAQHVRRRDGFLGAVGALLSVHAVIHGASAPPESRADGAPHAAQPGGHPGGHPGGGEGGQGSSTMTKRP